MTVQPLLEALSTSKQSLCLVKLDFFHKNTDVFVRMYLYMFMFKNYRHLNIDCGPQIILNGNLTGDTVYSGTATVICDTGYKVGGPAYCLISGSWKTPLPTCDPQGKSIIYSYQLAGSLDHDIIAQNKCTISLQT